MNLFPSGINLSDFNSKFQVGAVKLLGIQITSICPNYLEGEINITHHHHQPQGILHGGVSALFAETLGSIASALIVDLNKNIVVGTNLNINHLKSFKTGKLIGVVTPIHVGKTSHLWEIKIKSEDDALISITNLSVRVLENRN